MASQQDLYEPVEVSEADSKIYMRDVSTRKLQLQKKSSKDNLYSTSPAGESLLQKIASNIFLQEINVNDPITESSASL